MIKNIQKWREWESQYIAQNHVDLSAKFEMMDQMYEEAKRMGAFDRPPLEGLDHVIELARKLNVPTPARTDRQNV